MLIQKTFRLPLLRMSGAACLVALLTPSAHAQWAVVDVPATIQLVQEVLTATEQLETLKSELQQEEQTLESMSGNRGMQSLLSGQDRNYLPATWSQLSTLSSTTGGSYGGLAGTVQSLINANAVLTPQQVATLAPADQQQIATTRQWVATSQAVSQSALDNASERFASLQSLIDAIPSATDQKGALDLQARINAELGMLQNEQTKLQVLSQAMQAQEAADRQQEREQVIAAHGRFADRFQPVP
jgi:type IV secretion system protein VirB5